MVMPFPPPQSDSSYSLQTKERIIGAVPTGPGRTGKEIATSLHLNKSRVNSFLYGEGKREYGLMQKQWRWYSSASGGKEETSEQARVVRHQAPASPVSTGLPKSSQDLKGTCSEVPESQGPAPYRTALQPPLQFPLPSSSRQQKRIPGNCWPFILILVAIVCFLVFVF